MMSPKEMREAAEEADSPEIALIDKMIEIALLDKFHKPHSWVNIEPLPTWSRRALDTVIERYRARGWCVKQEQDFKEQTSYYVFTEAT